MRKILLISFCCISSFAFGQTIKYDSVFNLNYHNYYKQPAYQCDVIDSAFVFRHFVDSVLAGGGGSYSASGYLGLSGTAFYLDTTAHKAATKTDLASYYLASNPSGYISMVNNVWGTIITSFQDIAVDSTLVSTKKWRQKGIDSLNGVMARFVKYSDSNGAYTTYYGLDTADLAIREWADGTFITGNQNITLSGDVTGSGATAITTTIKNNVALAGSPTTTTQSSGDNSTKIATTAFVKNQGYSTTTGTVTSVGLVAGNGITVSGSPITGSGVMTVTATGSLVAGSGAGVTGSFPNYTVTATGSGGTVTSVGAVAGTGMSISGSSPITGAGTYTFTSTGSVTAGTGVSVAGSWPTYTVTNSSPSSGGTVTNFTATGGSPIYSVSVSNATTTPTLNITTFTQSPNTFLAGVSSGTAIATPTFRTIAAADLPTIITTINGTPVTNGGTATITAAANTLTTTTLNPSVVNSSLTKTGTITSGGLGTGATIGGVTMNLGSDITYDLYYGNASHILTRLGIGSNGQVLTVVGGALVYSTPPSSGGGLAYGNNRSVQLDSLGYQAGAQYVLIASDGDLNCISHTTSPSAPTAGTAKMYYNNQTGIDELHSVPSVGVESIQQSSWGQKIAGIVMSNNGAATGYGNYIGSVSYAGGSANVNKSYDATNLLPNYSYFKINSSASTNSSADIYISQVAKASIIGNNTYGAGSKLIITFGFNTYASNERFFAGYQASAAGALATTTDPSAWLNSVGVGKDAADGTLQVMYNAGSGTATKVNTSITPNANDIYRVTIFLPSGGSGSYVTVEDITKSSITKFNSSNTAKIPVAGTFLYPHIYMNTGASSTAVNMAVIQFEEEQY